MAQLVKALRYKPEIAGSISDGIDGIFHCHSTSALGLTQSQENFVAGKDGRCLGLTKTLPTSCCDCHEIWEPQPPGNLRVCPELQWDCFTVALFFQIA